MTSFVFYKFKSQRDESRVSFNGTGISVFDLKREIILAKGLEKATDVDILLLDPTTEEEYPDDRIIPRSSSVIVKRTPVRPGRSKTARYLAGVNSSNTQNGGSARPASNHNSYVGPMSKRFDVKEESKAAPTNIGTVIQGDEAAALDAMFAAETENWNATQEKMSQQQRIYSAPRFGNRKMNSAAGHSVSQGQRPPRPQESRSSPYDRPDRPIPAGYVCFRCGQKGHWIQDCPTNQDKEWDAKPRLKRTTGIPRSFLKTFEKTDDAPVGPGVMITPEGKLVVAQPDSAAWEKQIYRAKGLTEADVRERPVTDSSLACPICELLFRDAVRTPCCSTTYCEECIQNHLLENDFTCPNCQSKIPSLDRLVMDKPARTRVMDYVDKAIAESTIEPEDERPKVPRAKSSPLPDEVGNDQEVSFDEQPGGPQQEQGTDVAPNSENQTSLQQSQPGYQENQSLEQIQAEISQLQTMLSNPKLPAYARQQASMQLMQKQTLLNQAQTMSLLLSQAAAEASMNMPLPMPMPMMQPMMPMFNPMFAGGMNYGGGPPQQNMNMSHGQTQAANGWRNSPSQQQQTPDLDSAYQRLPVNNRRKVVKRDRPSDFVEVSGQAYQ